MINPVYLWERRKVFTRTIKNWILWTIFRLSRQLKGARNATAVVFVRQNARSRIYNHGYILRKNEGVRTILLTRIFDYQYHREAFDEIYVFFNKKDLQKKINRLNQRYNLIAVVGSTQPAWTARSLIEMPHNWPVLIDQYDSYWATLYFSGANPEESALPTNLFEEATEEAFCFQNVDGIIARSGELPILLKEHDVTTPYILLEDGCNPLFYQPIKSKIGPKKEEWSVVYAGMIFPMKLDSSKYGASQFVPLGELFAQERIHFHLYPSPHHNYQYPEYEAEAMRNPYFHLHSAVDFGKVHQEISQYDFGWMAVNSPRTSNILYSDVYYQHAISAKVYTYLEAGLPVIFNSHLKRVIQILQKTGSGFLTDDDVPRGLRAAIEKQYMEGLIQGVERARIELDINRRSGEIVSFIKTLREPYEQEK